MMKSNVLVNNTSSKMWVKFIDHNDGDRLLMGVIQELTKEKNKLYSSLLDKHIKDFYIDRDSLTIWI